MYPFKHDIYQRLIHLKKYIKSPFVDLDGILYFYLFIYLLLFCIYIVYCID